MIVLAYMMVIGVPSIVSQLVDSICIVVEKFISLGGGGDDCTMI